jgi:hypothetical protein
MTSIAAYLRHVARPKRNRCKLTEEQIDRICEMRESGKSYGTIARVVGCSVGAVSWQCLRCGAEPPTAKPIKVREPGEFQRGSHTVRGYTPEEDALIIALAIQKFPRTVIAKRLGRKPHSVLGRIMTLARREARLERADADLEIAL